LIVWIVALVVGTALFHAIGDGVLAAPPLEPSAWAAWAEGRDPLVATFAVLRLLVLALSWYLVGATSIGILARVLRAARLVRFADALTVPALRRFLQAALGVSLATAMVVSAVPGPAPGATEHSTVTLGASGDGSDEVRAAGAVQDGAVVTLTAAGEHDRVTLERVDDPRPLPLELLERARDAANASEAGDAANASEAEEAGEAGEVSHVAGDGQLAPDDPAAADEHLVRSGESFWAIAGDTLAEEFGRAPEESETSEYWERLVDANRDRLIDRDNADLIFPGQRLVLPTVGPSAGDAG
jgi:hypothetical protein